MNEHWLGNNQSTPVNPQSKCNLSPALLSRISFNSRELAILVLSHSNRPLHTRLDLSDDESTITEDKPRPKRLPEVRRTPSRCFRTLIFIFFKTPKRRTSNDESEKIEALLGSRQKLTSPASARGMRAIKSLSGNADLPFLTFKSMSLD